LAQRLGQLGVSLTAGFLVLVRAVAAIPRLTRHRADPARQAVSCEAVGAVAVRPRWAWAWAAAQRTLADAGALCAPQPALGPGPPGAVKRPWRFPM
jgi:hypothetical protein